MSPNRIISGLAVGVLSLFAGLPALAQELEDAQLFAPADISNPDGDQDLKHGYFFSWDALYLNVGKPETTSLGLPPPNSRTVFYNNDAAASIQMSSGDTSSLQSTRVDGNRLEFGYVGEYNGWYIGGYKLQDQFQQFELQNVSMVLNDPVVGAYGERSLNYLVNKVITGPFPYPDQPSGGNVPYLAGLPVRLVNMPLTFPTVDAYNTVQNYGAEVNYIRRFKPFHNGGNFDLYLGVRYFQFNEEFNVQTSSPQVFEQENVTTPTNIYLPRALNDSYWNTEVTNAIIGPQIGGRYYKNWGRFQLSLEGKFAAGFNEQTFRQDGEFFSMGYIQNVGNTVATASTPVVNGTPFNSTGGGFSNSATAAQFSPLVEARAEARYQLFQAVSIHAGWSGIWVDGIARACQSINYTYPTMGIDTSANNNSVFINGVTIGIDVNR